MFSGVGVAASAGVAAALLFGVSFVPTVLLHWEGQAWREGRHAPFSVPARPSVQRPL